MTVNKAAKHGCVAKSAAGRKSAAGLARIQKRESVMRRFIIAGLALGAPIVPVMAADMPAYDKVPVPAFSWTGFYLGGDIGVATTTDNAQWNPTSTSAAPFGVSPAGGGTGGASFVGGVLAGYDWQFANAWVAGVEADWTGMKAGAAFTEAWLGSPGGGVVPGGFTSLSSELEWTASVRARLGYLIAPRFLAYGTVGGAWGNFQYSASSINTVTGYAANAAFSDTKTGWVAGVGFEWAPFASLGLLLRAEYLNYGFGGAQIISAANGFPAFPSNYSWSSPNVSMARLAASYKF